MPKKDLVSISKTELDKLEKKAAYYNEICDLFFNYNFGSTSKSSIELLLFHQFIQDLERQNEDPANPGTIKYENISDFKIARKLGITPSRAHNLKLKEQLAYPRDNDNLDKYLLKALENVVFNEPKQTIELTILHPMLFSEIKDYIESLHGQVYIQLNKNLIELPLDSFVMLVNKAYGSKDMGEEEIQNLRSHMKKENKKTLPDKIRKAISYVKELKEGYELGTFVASIFVKAAKATM